jgi:phosphatidate cytidylyltransferase
MKRVLTAFVAIPIVVAITVFTPDWAFAFCVGLVSALAAKEFLSLAATGSGDRVGNWFILPVGLVSASFIGGAEWVVTAVAMATLVLLSVSAFSGSLGSALVRAAAGLTALVYCGFLLGFLVPMPRELILLLFVIVWVGDSAAYYGGRAFGHHPLAPKISPKKTVEGAIAGLVGSIVAGAIAGVVFLGEPWLSIVVISGVTAVLGQIGDLAESALKRSAGVKDSSSILPGHGGILDRLDSLFFAAPVFFWLFR